MKTLKLIENDPYLQPFENEINNRHQWFENTLNYINHDYGSIEQFASAYEYFGFNYDETNKGWWFREWAPNAYEINLIGDFNEWNHQANYLNRKDYGVWEIFLPDEIYQKRLTPFSKVKLKIFGPQGVVFRIPAYIRRVVQNPDYSFDGEFIPNSNFQWTDKNFKSKLTSTDHPIIYESHIGMATEEHRMGTYREFADHILPRVKNLGYNAVQLMAIMEHPYYGSFGYQVANFYAPSSKFGTPDDLRYLINKAHEMGISVILDTVHSHSVKNLIEGLSEFDGTELYFNGLHPDWDSKLFDYGKIEVKRFLISNLKYWMEEFHFDGFRFDGVTSMLYYNHGHHNFSDYADYFQFANNDAILYLQLANYLIHNYRPQNISICEDMSGMPGACRPISEGGLGFNYRLAMGLPDYWIKLLETKKDEEWIMGDLFWAMINRRIDEKNIGYVESHDQALVGDKTTAFWLMDKEMYEGMSIFSENLIVDRGIALHKMIRFITITLGGEGYMTFLGNEFGHPEWVDFPRADNGWSYQYARRQWSLADTDHLKYKFLYTFDKAMISYVKANDLLGQHYVEKLHEDNDNKVLIFTKNNLVFIFNFGWNSMENYQFYKKGKDKFTVDFSSDDPAFGGYDRVDKTVIYQPNQEYFYSIYLPSRTAIVLKQV